MNASGTGTSERQPRADDILRNQDSVGDADDAVFRGNVCLHDIGSIGSHFAYLNLDGHVFAVHNLSAHRFQIRSNDFSGKHVAGEGTGELVLILGLEQVIACACGKLGECFVGGCEDVERPMALRVSTQPAAFTGTARVLNWPEPAIIFSSAAETLEVSEVDTIAEAAAMKVSLFIGLLWVICLVARSDDWLQPLQVTRMAIEQVHI